MTELPTSALSHTKHPEYSSDLVWEYDGFRRLNTDSVYNGTYYSIGLSWVCIAKRANVDVDEWHYAVNICEDGSKHEKYGTSFARGMINRHLGIFKTLEEALDKAQAMHDFRVSGLRYDDWIKTTEHKGWVKSSRRK